MRVYWEFFKNEFQSLLVYRFSTVLALLRGIVGTFIQVAIWKALYRGATAVETALSGSITIDDMVTYVILSSVVYIVASSSIVERIDQRIKSGEIAIDFIRPVSFMGQILARVLGANTYRVVVEMIPLLIVAIPVFGIVLPGIEFIPLFTVTLLFGMIIHFLMTYIIGLLGFWYMSVWQLNSYLGMAISLLSGSFIPLWFFPGFLVSVSSYLPFRLIYFTPISIYLGKIELMEAAALAGQQVIWICILLAAQKLMWSAGVRKIVIQGG